MTTEELRMKAVGMDTPALANWMQTLAHERNGLRGRMVGNKKNLERNSWLKVRIKVAAQELTNRQLRMEGF